MAGNAPDASKGEIDMRHLAATARYRPFALNTALAATLFPLFASGVGIPAALAQTSPQTTADEGNESAIVVTARRREETLIDVPIAVTAITGAQLQKSGAIDITDIAAQSPNVTLEVSRGTNSTLSAFIRGVGQQDPVAGFENGVGIYLDDVYLNRPQAAVLDIYDVERIEVLRGPQGTLYGRNTIGGAVKYVTRHLSAEPEMEVRATYGSYNQADLVVTASTPLGQSGLRFGVAGAVLTRDGFGKNLTTGDENYNKHVLGARASLEFDNGGPVFIRLSGDYTEDTSNPRGGHRLIPALVAGTPVLSDVFDSQGGLVDPPQKVTGGGGSLYAEWKATDAVTLRSITGYRKDDSATPIDFDALPQVDVDVPAFYNNKQFSQELQLLVHTGGLDALLGGYYLDADARTVFDVRLPASLTALTYGKVGTKTYAVFGDATYNLTPQLSISAGGRYTWDERTSTILRNVYIGPSPYFGGTSAPIVQQSNFHGSRDFRKFTPRASISFKPTPDQNIYASWAKGFKGGGFDPRGLSTAAPDSDGDGKVSAEEIFNFLTFDPETVTTYELGYKASLINHRLNFSFAAFQSDYKDVQIPGSIGATVGGIQTFIGITTNAAKARIKGLEFEGNAILAEDFVGAGSRLTLSGNAGYLDAKFRKYIDSRGIDVASERKFQNTPKWTAAGTLAVRLPVADGMLDLGSTVSYRGSSQQFELATPMLDQKGFALWDANLVWTAPGARWTFGVHGRNLTNKKYIVSGYNFLLQNPDTGAFVLPNGQPGYSSTLGSQGVLTAYYGNPRQVFATVGLKF